MRAGSIPASIMRMTRSTNTWVLPEPALAATQAEDAGSDASICLSVALAAFME